MKIIDLLNKIAKNEEVPRVIIFDNQIWKKENGSRNNLYYMNDSYHVLFVVIFKNNKTYSLNDEIEIIEEETTYEQNFTGWKLIQNGKVVASYSCDKPTLKPVDVSDVEKDIKGMLEEKPKKIENIQHSSNDSQNVKKIKSKIDELIDTVNYLLEKVPDNQAPHPPILLQPQ